MTKSKITELRPDLYLIPSIGPGSHVFLIKGTSKNVLIDTGLPIHYTYLKECLAEMKLAPRDIHLIILTHEHFDHIGGAIFFTDTSIIAAHRLAANKMMMGDEFVLMNKYFDQPVKFFSPDIWLEADTTIELGNYTLRTIHTPGHCSGCICLYEPNQGLLFTGDTVLAGGVISGIYTSGSISDYMNSLNRLRELRIEAFYPSHGRMSTTPLEDLDTALERSRSLMLDTRVLFNTLSTTETYNRLLSSAKKNPNPWKR